uniref:Uncharacterized protein n=1 Tax=Pseudo-nitzschia australis TaxID=44445 RepID=A0A7S4ANF9_9STRA|mmetsp:Transcript_17639/g.38536  ORF Transcript_17639/g.38536 Transcript_17639/m.38536 type:complete len:623 (-) Transcript_17639:534-2402(-)
MSGLLGFRARKASAAKSFANSDNHDIDDDYAYGDGVSIVSIPTDRSHQFVSLERKHKESSTSKKKKKNDVPCAQIVMSDVSFNSVPPPVEEAIDSFDPSTSPTHEFLVQCDNGERIFVPSRQGMLIKSRCRHFRLALSNRSGSCSLNVGGSNSNSGDDATNEVEKYELDNSVIKKEHWSPRTARHVIELLSEGTTWIENENRRFVELLKACDEISARLCLGSIINYSDVLDPASSLRFFKLKRDAMFRFKLAGTIRSSQWMFLLQKGILLHLDSTKILMLSSALSNDNEGSGRQSKIKEQRLSKCDDLYSQFSVYSEMSKINTLYAIFDLLSATATTTPNEIERKAEKNPSQNRSVGGGENPLLEESFRIICKTKRGAMEEQDLNMLWRMTSASYTLSTEGEQRFLRLQSCDGSLVPTNSLHPLSRSVDLPLGDNFQIGTNDHESVDGQPKADTTTCSSSINSPPRTPFSALTEASNHRQYETRTIAGTSLAVLQHLFDPMNNRFEKTSPNNEYSPDSSLLPACLSIANPTPDTLGRFLNGCACTAKLDGSSKVAAAARKIGYHIASPPFASTNSKKNSSIIFFVSGTSRYIKDILKYVADYSNPSIVGEADFKLEQLRQHG